MENIDFIRFFKTLPWHGIIRFSWMFILAGIVMFLFKKQREFVDLVNKIPNWKLRFYHIMGHSTIILYVRLFSKALPSNVYDFLLINGYCFIFMKEGLANIWAFYHPMIFVFKAETVETILSHSTQLEKAWNYKFTQPWIGEGLLTSHGAKWKTRRKLLTSAFHFNILQNFLPVFNKQAKTLIEILDRHTGDEFIDVVPFVTKCSLDVICESLLGVEMHVQTKPSNPYVESVKFLTNAIAERTINPLLWSDLIFKIIPMGRKFARHVKLVHDFTYGLMRDKKEELKEASQRETASGNQADEIPERKKRAFLDLLLDEHINNGTLSEKDIIEEIDTFTFEGHDTTAMSMSSSLYLIGLHPEVQRKIHAELDNIFGDDDRLATMDDLKEMKYLECVLKESLRLYPSVPIYGRRLNEDLEIQGRVVPKGSTCFILSYMLHRNPDYFPNPEKFDPDRFLLENSIGRHPFAYVPFSAGPRNCIGQRFAVMEEKIVISTILRKFKVQSLDPRDKVHFVEDVVLRPINDLRLQVRPRSYMPENPLPHFYA